MIKGVIIEQVIIGIDIYVQMDTGITDRAPVSLSESDE